ncbi:hypothetical protein [Streptomyces sp. KL116D]|uniref:hypothetical protein n=1 Tax=Streptomyces sp. KL116D TaxID=3045152 RepID=UPI00355788E4
MLWPGALAAVPTSAERRAEHIEALLAVVRSRAYDGLDLDYETIAPTPEAGYRAVRAGYATFVTDPVPACTRPGQAVLRHRHPGRAPRAASRDYRIAGRRRRPDAHHGLQPAPRRRATRPIATPQWYDEIPATATAQVPPAVGDGPARLRRWDWGGRRDRAHHVTWKDAEALRASQVGAPYVLDPGSRTPHFTYEAGKTRHTAWYQTLRGTAAHLPAPRTYVVRNTVPWALNFRGPRRWRRLADGRRRKALSRRQGGRRSNQRWSASSWAASEISSGSLWAGPRSCAPTGRPSPTRPAGTFTPGQPSTFHGQA